MTQAFRLKPLLRSPLFWLAVLYLFVGTIYAVITPALEKPQEDGHYGYVLFIRQYHALPPLFTPSVFRRPDFKGEVPLYYVPAADQSSTRKYLADEFKQPPLYYVITAIATSWLPDDPDPDELTIPNPYITAAEPGTRNDNRNIFLHPPDMTTLVLAGRLVSLLIGLGAVVASYWLAAQLFPHDAWIPITTAAVLGFQPNFLYMATTINNDILITLLGTLTVLLLMIRLRKGEFPFFAPLLGALLGLSSLAKVSGLVFFPLTGLALLLVHRGFRRAFFRDGILIAVVALAVGGWWYARNALVYGDPLTLRTHNVIGATETREVWGRLGRDLLAIEYTYWANEARIFISPIWLDQVLIWWGRISLVLLGLGVALRYRSIRDRLPGLVILTSWPAVFFFLLVGYWNQNYSWTFGRLLFPAIAPTTLMFIMGWRFAIPRRWGRLVVPVMKITTGIVIAAGILTPAVTLYPLFHPWREWEAAQVQHPVGIVYAETGLTHTGPVARLIGYNLIQPTASPGGLLTLELCWEALGRTETPYAVFVQLLDLGQLESQTIPTVWGRRETFPGLGNRPTDRWTVHQPFCDKVFVPVFPEAPTPLGVALQVGLTTPDHRDQLQAVDADGEPIELTIVGRVPIVSTARPSAQPAPRFALDSAIGLNDLQVTAEPPSSLTVTLAWQSLHPVAYDAMTFVHVRDATGHLLAQADRQPLDGRFPTSLWLPGQTITDVVSLTLPPGALSDPLTLNLGLYKWPSLERLPVVDAVGIPQPDRMMVLHIPFPNPR